ncbi:putative major facilitator superfamily transporter [Rhodococcus wratislaviensis NBRC 100605]|uniref:Putative major facilitator superfamily transporter n=2 Tax=Rhodococcus wratislaviensis TaxID=44752 RepID=X0PR38_RHOWR|nr:putative major facilitator superfamily transporter [Rhodococcus wratislaviensis NBRC 100605]
MNLNESISERQAPVDSPPRPSGVSRTRAWQMTVLLAALYVVNYADKAVLGIIAQPLARELGLTSAQVGLVGSMFFLAFTIGGFFAGVINRYTSLRWALLILAAAWSVVMLPLVLAASMTVLLVSRMLLGLTEGPSTALVHTAAYSWHPPVKRGLPSAFVGGAASVAKIALAPALAYITIEMGWRAAIVSLTVLGVVWMVVWMLTWTEGPYTKKVASVSGDIQPEATEPSVPWSRILLSRTFVSCSILIMAIYALSTVVLTWLPSYFEVGLGYSALQAGSMFALPSVLGLVLMLSAGTITDRLLQRGATSRALRIVLPATGVLVGGVVLVFLPQIGTPALAVATVSVGYACVAATVPLLNSAISELCPPQQTAGTMGMFLAIMAIGGLIAPYMTGVMVDNATTKAEGYAQAFQLIGVIGAVAAIIVVIFANPERDKARIRGL